MSSLPGMAISEAKKEVKNIASNSASLDVEQESKSAGKELIQTICKTLNSEDTKLFSVIIENSVKSYFSKNNPDAQKMILGVIENNIKRICDSLIDKELQTIVFKELLHKDSEEINTWIIDIIKNITSESELKAGEIEIHLLNNESISRISDTIIKSILQSSSISESTSKMEGGKRRKYRRTYRKYHNRRMRNKTKKMHGGDGVSDKNIDQHVTSLQKRIDDISNKYEKGEISEEDANKQADEVMNESQTITSSSDEKINEALSTSGSIINQSSSSLGCDDIMDRIETGKVLNENEKTILKYLDFKMKPNMDEYQISSKLLYVVENALNKQINSEYIAGFLKTHLEQELPVLIKSVYDQLSLGNTMKHNIIKSLLREKEVYDIMHTGLVRQLNKMLEESKRNNTDKVKFIDIMNTLNFMISAAPEKITEEVEQIK